MRLSPVETQVFDAIKDLEVIDAHEHLVPETHRVQRRVDFSTLFAHYTRADFISAGMQTEIYQRMINEETMPVEKKWAAFHEFYPMIRLGSYARPARIWLQDVLGLDDLTTDNCREVSERLQADNTLGLYDRVLRQRCNIRCAIVDNPDHYTDTSFSVSRKLSNYAYCHCERSEAISLFDR